MAEAKGEPRSSTNIVTSENRAEFMSKKLGLDQVATLEKSVAEVKEPLKEEKKPAPKAKADEKPEAILDEPEEEVDEKGAKLTPEQKQERKKTRLSDRMRELSDDAKKAKEQVKAEREAREKAEAEREAIRAKYEPRNVELGPEPQFDLYADKQQFMKDHAKWAGDKAIRERDAEQAEERAKVAYEARIKTWNERQAAVRKEVPDYDEKISASSVKVSEQVRDAIVDSEAGPRILLHFSTEEGQADAERIGKMTVGGALRAIGKLEARFADEAEKASAQAAKVQTGKEPITQLAEISKAPAPISPLRGANAPVELPVNSKGEFSGTYEQFKALRNSGKLK